MLSLQHEVLPQSLHFDNAVAAHPVGLAAGPGRGQGDAVAPNGRPRRAGVSSFGFTGTNAHVLIEEAPPHPAIADDEHPASADDVAGTAESDPQARPVDVLALSARSPEALVAVAQRYEAWLTAHPDVDLADVCLTAGTGRSHFEHRAALVVDSVESAREGLAELVENRLRPGVVRGEHTHRPTTAWLFTGQGSQYPGMARELFDAEPVFAETVTRCADAVDDVLPRPLLEVVFATDREAGETLRHTSFAQPALFAVEMGLARLWQSWGIEPDVVLGHSVGQYAAACVAGVFSLEDGARLMAERGRLFGSLPEGGRMVAVFADAKHVEEIAGEFPRVSVGAYNGPNTVLSGPGEDLEQIVARFGDEAIRCTWLETSHAFHSELLDPVLDEFESYAAQLEFAVPTLPLVCNRTGAVLTAQTPIDAPVLAAALPPAGAIRRERAHRGGAGMLGDDGDRPATGSDRGRGAGMAGTPGRAAGDRLAAQGRRRPAPDRRRAGRGLRQRPPTRFRCAASINRAADSNCPPIHSSAGGSGPRRPGIAMEGGAGPSSGLLGSAKDLSSGDVRLHQQVVRQIAAMAFRPRHLRHRRRPWGNLCSDGVGGGRSTGAGERCLIL